MKLFKKLTLGMMSLAMMLGVGFAVAKTTDNIQSNDVVETKANTGHTWGLIGSWNSWNSDVATSGYDSVQNVDVLSYYIESGKEFQIRADSAWTKSTTGNGLSGINSTWFSTSNNNCVVNSGYSGYYSFLIFNGAYDYGDPAYGMYVYRTSTSVLPASSGTSSISTTSGTSYITLSATPSDSYAFAYWTTDTGSTVSSSNNPYNFTPTMGTNHSSGSATFASVFLSSSTFTLNFTSTTSTTIYAYCWQNSTGYKNAAYPGKAMTRTQSGNNYCYTLTGVSKSFDYVIFNQNSETVKTDNLTLSELIENAYSSNITFVGTISSTISGFWYINSAPTLTSSYARIWLHRGGFKDTSGYIWTLHLYNDSADYEFAPTGYETFISTKILAYYDIPTSLLSTSYTYQFKCFVDTTGVYSDSSQTFAFTSNLCTKISYLSGSSPYTVTQGSIGDSEDGTISASSVAKVLKAFYSCSNSSVNGYGAFNTVETTWIKSSPGVYHVSVNNMQTQSMYDCLSTSNYSTGERTLSTTVYNKYQIMLAQYNGTYQSGALNPGNVILDYVNDNQTMLIMTICIVGVVGFTAIGAYYFIFSKKTKHKKDND